MDSQVIAFTLAAAALTVAPGPDNMLVIRNVVRGGRREGIVTGLAICSGLFVHATLSALGVSVVLLHSAAAFHLLKIAGACYLVWLGLQSLWSARNSRPAAELAAQLQPIPGAGMRRCLREGFLSNVLNPKTAVFYLAFLPQFIGPTEPVLAKSLLLAGIHCVEGVLWFIVMATLLDRMKQVLLKSSVRRWMDGLCGTLLIAFGARLAFARR